MAQGPAEADAGDKVRCDACPVTCYIRRGMAGACDRYANRDGRLVRVDPHILLERTVERGGSVVPFSLKEGEWSGEIVPDDSVFVTAVGAGHDLSGLQARALHRLLRGRGRRYGDRRDRGHLQLLRRQGEGRHRPLSRPRAGDGARRRRSRRPCDDGRIWFADDVARRRASPDRRLEGGRPRHLRRRCSLSRTAGRSN